MTRTLYCARSPLALSVEITPEPEPQDVAQLVDEVFPGHPERTRLIVAILDRRHEDARRIASAYVSPVAQAFAALAASMEAA